MSFLLLKYPCDAFNGKHQSDKEFRPDLLWTGDVRPWVWEKPVTVRHLDSRKGDGIEHRILGDDAVLME